MDRSLGKEGVGIFKDEGGSPDIQRGNLVGDIHNLAARVRAQDRTLQGARIFGLQPEIGYQGHDPGSFFSLVWGHFELEP
jgi:hypothetical protein